MADIFLSYASGDRERVRSVAEALERQGWSVWWDRHILPGQNWDDLIAGELEAAKCIVVLWTRTSIVSEWVRIEANIGRERGILAPVLLDDVPLPLTFRQIQTAGLSSWSGDESFPELVALFAGIRAILSGRTAPAGLPPPVAEERALDAALGRELPVHKPANLIAMVRRADSAGLKAILEVDDEYGLSGEDVVTKPFEITFGTDAAGRPLPAEILLRIVSPEFDPAMQEKKILIRAQRDSTVCSFLLTPLEPGHLTMQLELYIREACVASRILRANGVPSGRPATVHGHQIVTMPLYVNVSGTEFHKFFQAPAAVPAPSPVSLPRGERNQTIEIPVRPPAPRQAPPKRSSAMWWKAGVAAALVLLCVPVIHFQILTQRGAGGPQSVEPPSVKPSQPAPEAPIKAPRPVPRPKASGSAGPKVMQPRSAPPEAPPAQPAKEAVLRFNRERLTRLSARANSVKADLLRVRKEYSAKGLELNTDVLAAESRLAVYLDEADAASRAGDAVRMKKSLDGAEGAVESIENFLAK